MTFLRDLSRLQFMNIDEIYFNKNAINAADCIGQGWELLKPNYWRFFGIGLLMMLSGCIPIVSWFLTGPIAVGIYFALLKSYRGEPIEFGMMFEGFKKFVPAMIIGFVMTIPGIVVNTYRLGVNIVEFMALSGPSLLTAEISGILAIISLFLSIIAFFVSIIFGITFIFSFPLLAEYDLSMIDTVKLSARAGWVNFGGLLLLFILTGLILVGGILALCIGIFFVLPLIYSSILIAYKQVFPSTDASPQNSTPPPPTEYGDMFDQGA